MRARHPDMQIELKLIQTQVGTTFIFVTHDQQEALSMSDRIAVMLDGHIEQLADPDTIYNVLVQWTGWQGFDPGLTQGQPPTVLNTVSAVLFLVCCAGIAYVALSELPRSGYQLPLGSLKGTHTKSSRSARAATFRTMVSTLAR